VHVRSTGDVWTEAAILYPSDPLAGHAFGASVAIDMTTQTLVVGANGATANEGVYAFVWSGTAWTEQQKLVGDATAGTTAVGTSVSVSGDSLAFGASTDNTQASQAGAVYVWTRTASTWTQQSKEFASDAALDDQFGHAVAIDGDILVAGAFMEDATGVVDAGSAYVLVRSMGVWSEQAKLVADASFASDMFGHSVDVSGTTIVVGAHGKDVNGPAADTGSAFVYVQSGTVWPLEQRLDASDPLTLDEAAYSVSIEGDIVAMGAHMQSADDRGAVYAFARDTGVWTEANKLVASDGAAGDHFGAAVSVDDCRVVVGAPDKSASAGCTYVFNVCFTPGGLPSEPLNAVGVSAGDAEATVSFDPPTSDGGTPISEYKLTSSPGGIVGSCSTSPCTVSGLTNGVAYTFTVAACNLAGTGPSSAPTADELMPLTAAQALAIETRMADLETQQTYVGASPPQTFVVTSTTSGQASATFTPPAADGGCAVTAYVLTATEGSHSIQGPASPLVLSGLVPGDVYTFTLRAINCVGHGTPAVSERVVIAS
jgi:hypothetical protein